MKMIKLSQGKFNELESVDRVEYLLRKDMVVRNIRKSIPFFEFFAIILVNMYGRLHNLSILNLFGFSEISKYTISVTNNLIYTITVVLLISMITRIGIYYMKHRQLNLLNEEFLDRLIINSSIKRTTKKKVSNEKENDGTKI